MFYLFFSALSGLGATVTIRSVVGNTDVSTFVAFLQLRHLIIFLLISISCTKRIIKLMNLTFMDNTCG